jgi:ribosomal protein S12 methylthiotransferase accessory factor
MRMDIALVGGDRVEARYRDQVVVTDQDGSAPAPFQLFLASIGTCAGFYVQSFCRHRDIPTDGIRIRQVSHTNRETHHVDDLSIEIELPEEFPERYRAAVLRAVDQCAVKRHLVEPPNVTVEVVAPE